MRTAEIDAFLAVLDNELASSETHLEPVAVNEMAAIKEARLQAERKLLGLALKPATELIYIYEPETATPEGLALAERRLLAVRDTLTGRGCADTGSTLANSMLYKEDGQPYRMKTYFRNIGRGAIGAVDFIAMQKSMAKEEIESHRVLGQEVQIIAFNIDLATPDSLADLHLPLPTINKYEEFKTIIAA
ncbi:MAG: hypothetical protein M3Q14_02685 [bacterium]|nr:hypothetical protein [bacterium]